MSRWAERDAVRTIELRRTGDDIWEPIGSPSEIGLQQRFDIGTTTIYVGTAVRGAASDAPEWTIKKITLVSGSPTQAQWTDERAAVWDDRGSETYT